MFITLLVVTFVIAALVSYIVARGFRGSIDAILERVVGSPLAAAWRRYVTFAIYVVGISGGVRIYALEQYILPRGKDQAIPALTTERWLLEVYRTIIGTLQSIAWMLLVFFVVALIAYVIVRIFEMRHGSAAPAAAPVPTAHG